jgi:hypothetical protein
VHFDPGASGSIRVIDMDATTGIIPEHLMYPQCKKQVISWLIAQPLTSDRKRELLNGWAITVGCRCKSMDYHMVEVSGVDGVIPLGG